MKLLLPLFLVFFLLSSSTCKRKKAPSEGQNATTEIETSINLLESQWYLKSMKINGRSISIFPATLDIHGEIISGNGGCNAFRGTYKAQGSRIVISRLGATKKYCQEASQFESKYLKALQACTQYKQDDKALTLTSPKETLVFSLETPTKKGTVKELSGSWLLISIAEGDARTAIPSGVLLNFKGNKISGKGGCNSYFGNFSAKGNEITMSDIGATEMYCERTSDFETAFFRYLSEAKSYSIDNGLLKIETATGVMTFRKKDIRGNN